MVHHLATKTKTCHFGPRPSKPVLCTQSSPSHSIFKFPHQNLVFIFSPTRTTCPTQIIILDLITLITFGAHLVGVPSKAHVCRGSITRIAVSNLVDGIGVRLLCLMCGVPVAPSAASRSLVYRSTNGCVCVYVCVCVFVCNCWWSRKLNNEAAYSRFRLLCQRKRK